MVEDEDSDIGSERSGVVSGGDECYADSSGGGGEGRSGERWRW